MEQNRPAARTLMESRISLVTTLMLIRLHCWGSSLRTRMGVLRSSVVTALALLILFRRPFPSLKAYLRKTLAVLIPGASAASSADGQQGTTSPESFTFPGFTRKGIFRSGYRFFRSIFVRTGSGEGAVLRDPRVRRLQARIAGNQLEKIFGIVPTAEELEVLSAFAGIDWLYRCISLSAGYAASSRVSKEALYRVRVVYPTFLRLLRLRFEYTELSEGGRFAQEPVINGSKEVSGAAVQKLSGLYPRILSIEQIDRRRKHAVLQARGRRLSAAAWEEICRLRLHFSAASAFETGTLKKPYKAEKILSVFESIHFQERRSKKR